MRQFFQLKSSFYFLKNVVFALFCFVLGYLLGSGIIKAEAADSSFEEVKAYDYTWIYDEFRAYDYQIWRMSTNEKFSYKSELERLIKNLDDLNIQYMITVNDLYTRKYITEHNSINNFNFSIYIFNSNEINLYHDGSVVTFGKNGTKYKSYTLPGGYHVRKNLNTLSDYIEQNHSLPTTDLKWEESPYSGIIRYNESNPFGPNLYNFGNLGSLVYRSNVNLKIESKVYNAMKIGSVIYSDQVPIYDQVKDYGKVMYTFNETVSASNSQIRFKFDIPKNEMFTFYFNHNVTYSRAYMNSAPHLAYTEVDNRIITHNYKLPLDKRFDSETEVVYSDTQMNVFNSDTTSLEFVVELNNQSGNNDGTVHIFFESEYPFTYQYETKEHYTTIDFTNKYGVLLIPKVYKTDVFEETEVYSTVYFHGYNLFLRTYASTDLTQKPLDEYNHLGHKDNNTFYHYKYLFRADKKSQTLFILDKDYLTSTHTNLLKYDTRYFVHSICSTIDSCETIVNPNTGEEITVKPPNPNDLDEENKNIFDQFDEVFKKDNPFFQKINTVWDSFRTSKIFDYFLILISGTLIIILISALNRR